MFNVNIKALLATLGAIIIILLWNGYTQSERISEQQAQEIERLKHSIEQQAAQLQAERFATQAQIQYEQAERAKIDEDKKIIRTELQHQDCSHVRLPTRVINSLRQAN